MPPKPIAPATIANHTCGLRSACSSRRPVASGLPGQSGTNASTSAMVSAASPATTQYDARQPRCLAEPGRGRHADHVGDREPHQHQRDGAAAPLGGDHARRDQRGDAEVAAVRQPVEEPGDHQRPVVRGQGAQRVEQGVGRHQADQQPPAGQLRAEVGEHRGADDHAERVRRDDPAGHRDRHVHAVGDLGQHAHGHELGGADREPTDGQREDGEPEVRRSGPGGRVEGRGGRRRAVHWHHRARPRPSTPIPRRATGASSRPAARRSIARAARPRRW